MFVQNGDVIQLEIVGEMQGQTTRNVFQYLMGHGEGGLVNISDMIPLWFIGFDTAVLRHLSETATVTGIVGKNLTDPNQIYEESVTANGDLGGDALPVHDTLSVKLIRSSGITRNGRKSYSGIPEDYSSDGELTYNAGIIDPMELWHSEAKDIPHPDTPTVVATFNPVIVGRTPDVNGVYQLDLAKVNPIRAAKVNIRIRTQNTRKF